MKNNITILGGAGHIGLPLALLFSEQGYKVNILDKNRKNLAKIKQKIMPFKEKNAQTILNTSINKKLIILSDNIKGIKINGPIVICIGTPVDEYGNPNLKLIFDCIDEIKSKIKNNLLIFRSTLSPGTSRLIYDYLTKHKITKNVSFCPERVLQGKSIEEIKDLPQIVSAFSKKAEKLSKNLFKIIANEMIICKPEEAELAKLFTNSFRYINFAIANQFYNISEFSNQNFNNILKIMKYKYPRMENIPSAGFAAGPCLYKDTLQLASFCKNNFSLGHASLNINEGFVFTIIEKIKKLPNFKKLNIGLLGMAFKPNIDDNRTSLSYKLKNHLKYHVRNIYTHDPYVKNDKDLKSFNYVYKNSDILIICVPHDYYSKINFNQKKIIDVWGKFI